MTRARLIFSLIQGCLIYLVKTQLENAMHNLNAEWEIIEKSYEDALCIKNKQYF